MRSASHLASGQSALGGSACWFHGSSEWPMVLSNGIPDKKQDRSKTPFHNMLRLV